MRQQRYGHIDVPLECVRNTEIGQLILMGVAWILMEELFFSWMSV